MKKKPIRAPKNDSLKRRLQRKLFNDTEGKMMMEDLLTAMDNDQLPHEEVRQYFRTAFEKILEGLPEATTTNKKGSLLIKSLGLREKRGKKPLNLPDSKHMDIAVARHNGMPVAVLAEQFDIDETTVRLAVKRCKPHDVPLQARLRSEVEEELSLLGAALQAIGDNPNKTTTTDDCVITTALPLDMIPFDDEVDESHLSQHVSLLSLYVSRFSENVILGHVERHDGKPVIPPLSCISSVRKARLELLELIRVQLID